MRNLKKSPKQLIDKKEDDKFKNMPKKSIDDAFYIFNSADPI